MTDDVISQKVHFGVGRSSLILKSIEGEPVYLLSAIFQHSPFMLLTKKREDLKKARDLKGKRIMVTDDIIGMASLTAMLVGICIADRASELSVLPGFLIAMIFAWKKFKLGIIRSLLAIVIFVLPFVYTVSFYFMRTGQEYLHVRDSGIRNSVLSKQGFTEFKPRKDIKWWEIKYRAKQRLGMGYRKDAKFVSDRVSYDFNKYKWLLSGACKRY